MDIEKLDPRFADEDAVDCLQKEKILTKAELLKQKQRSLKQDGFVDCDDIPFEI